MSQGRTSFGDTVDFERKLFRPWSFAAHSTSQSDGMEIPLIENTSTKPQSASRWPRHSATLRQRFEAEPTVRPTGWWNDQMLFDRSLRSMAILMTLYATIMTIVCIAYLKDFVHRGNPHSTSVGQKKGRSCKSLQSMDIVCIIACVFVLRLTP